MVSHAGISNVMVKALYSHPSSPMQLSYGDEGILSEFIFMTIGESRGGSATPVPDGPIAGSKRPASRQPLQATSSSRRATTSMPPPPMNATPSLNRESMRSKVSRPSPPPPQPSVQSQGLFLEGGEGDEDRRWDPANFDEEEEEMLLWDTGGEKVRAKDLE